MAKKNMTKKKLGVYKGIKGIIYWAMGENDIFSTSWNFVFSKKNLKTKDYYS